ncbi:unnamed protein product [Moneuplotes crassus]|uniref:Uncharacterized protein n=1 Tax=Euplotes crassus TaxID=5936 RepID=A0AAD1YA28_EUPCR|nr:unnamed protein product [Moneuplotes crassus]
MSDFCKSRQISSNTCVRQFLKTHSSNLLKPSKPRLSSLKEAKYKIKMEKAMGSRPKILEKTAVNAKISDCCSQNESSVLKALNKSSPVRKLATERDKNANAKSFNHITQKREFTTTRLRLKDASSSIYKYSQSAGPNKPGLLDCIRKRKQQSKERIQRKELSSKIDKLLYSKNSKYPSKASTSQPHNMATVDTPMHIKVDILKIKKKMPQANSRTKNGFSSTMSESKLGDLRSCSAQIISKGYVEGEENIKDTEDLASKKDIYRELNSNIRPSATQYLQEAKRISSSTNRDLTTRTSHRVDKDSLWLVNVIRQSSRESQRIMTAREDCGSRSRDNHSKSSRKGFYNKNKAQHQYIPSRKGSEQRMTNSQNRVAKSFNMTTRLNFNTKKLENTKNQTSAQSYDDFQSSIQIKNLKRQPLSLEREEKLNQSGYAEKHINLLDTSHNTVGRRLFSDDGENNLNRNQSVCEAPRINRNEGNLIKIELHEEDCGKPSQKVIHKSKIRNTHRKYTAPGQVDIDELISKPRQKKGTLKVSKNPKYSCKVKPKSSVVTMLSKTLIYPKISAQN